MRRPYRLTTQIELEQEYGCLMHGKIHLALVNTAIKHSLENVTCLQVNPMDGKTLPVYAEPTTRSKRLRLLVKGKTVNPGSFAAYVAEHEGQVWVTVEAPVKGWIAHGKPGSQGTLRLCHLPK